jgi:hypothetical protein
MKVSGTERKEHSFQKKKVMTAKRRIRVKEL